MTGNILAEISRHVARPEIEKIPCLAAADDANGFAVEEVGLGMGRYPAYPERKSED